MGVAKRVATADVSAALDPAAIVKALVLQGHRLNAATSNIGAVHGLSTDEWLVLDALSSFDGLSMSEVGARVLSSGASLTRTVDRLVGRSLVYRNPSANDRRKVQVHISDLGRRVHHEMANDLVGVDDAVRAALAAAGVDPDAAAGALADMEVSG